MQIRPLEVEVQSKQQPSGVSAGAWQFELDQQRPVVSERKRGGKNRSGSQEE